MKQEDKGEGGGRTAAEKFTTMQAAAMIFQSGGENDLRDAARAHCVNWYSVRRSGNKER